MSISARPPLPHNFTTTYQQEDHNYEDITGEKGLFPSSWRPQLTGKVYAVWVGYIGYTLSACMVNCVSMSISAHPPLLSTSKLPHNSTTRPIQEDHNYEEIPGGESLPRRELTSKMYLGVYWLLRWNLSNQECMLVTTDLPLIS